MRWSDFLSAAREFCASCAGWLRRGALLLLCGGGDGDDWRDWLCAARRLLWAGAVTVCAYFTAVQVRVCTT